MNTWWSNTLFNPLTPSLLSINERWTRWRGWHNGWPLSQAPGHLHTPSLPLHLQRSPQRELFLHHHPKHYELDLIKHPLLTHHPSSVLTHHPSAGSEDTEWVPAWLSATPHAAQSTASRVLPQDQPDGYSAIHQYQQCLWQKADCIWGTVCSLIHGS